MGLEVRWSWRRGVGLKGRGEAGGEGMGLEVRWSWRRGVGLKVRGWGWRGGVGLEVHLWYPYFLLVSQKWMLCA